MKYLALFLFGIQLTFGATHKVIVKFDAPQDPTVALSNYSILSWRQLGNKPVYRLRVDTSMNKQDLIQSIENDLAVLKAEENQRTATVTLEGASQVDSRVIFIIDEIYGEGTYTTSSGGVNSRVIFIIDGGESEFAPLYDQYHVTHVRADWAWEHTTGAGQTVAVIDTGVDIDHPFLVSNLVHGYDFVDGDSNPDEERLDLDTNGNGILDEGYGHGTHVAGIIKTVAPGASIMPIKVADSDGQAELSSLIEGINYAVDNGADVINLSMSISEPSHLLYEAIENARQAGIVVVTSAGNDNSDNLYFPATESEVLTVAAVDVNYTKAHYSNYGQLIDIAAPGHDIVSAHPGGVYAKRSGTSMAAPVIAAQAAIIFELVPNNSVSYVTHRIKNKTKNIRSYNPGTRVRDLADVWDSITLQNQN